MKKVLLLLIGLIALGCSKSEDKIDYKDIDGMWNFKEETNYSEVVCALLVVDWKKEFFLTATEKIRNEEKKVSKKGSFKYKYPYLTLISDDESYPIKFKLSDDKKSLTLDGYILRNNIIKDNTKKIIQSTKKPSLRGLFLFFTQWYRLFLSIGLLGKRLRGFG